MKLTLALIASAALIFQAQARSLLRVPKPLEPSLSISRDTVKKYCKLFKEPLGVEEAWGYNWSTDCDEACEEILPAGWTLVSAERQTGNHCHCIWARPVNDISEMGNASPCVETTSDWVRISGGGTTRIWEKTSFQTTDEKSVALQETNSISASTGVSAFGIQLSVSATQEVSHIATETVSKTFGKEEGIEVSVDCQNGQVFQWVTTMEHLSDGKINTIKTNQFVCLPNSIPNMLEWDASQAKPRCPATYCYNTTPEGKGAGCQCCNSANWVPQGEDGRLCE